MDAPLSISHEASRVAERPSLSTTSSHHSRVPTTTRNEPRSGLPRPQTASLITSHLVLWVAFFTCWVSLSSASSFFIDEQMVETRQVETLESTFARLARSGTILVDRSPPPAPASDDQQHGVPAGGVDDLRRRREVSSSSSASIPTTMRTATSSSSSTSSTASSSATTSIPVAVSTSTSELPSPFDLGFSGNITSGCQSFMSSMLTNSTFKACLPFSMLLQNSNSFFQAQKSLVRITQTLDYSCAANITTCSRLMASFATNITTAAGCAADLASQNPMIQQARLGLLAYKPLYSASCLRNPSTSSYCFADAITNSNNSADAYVYYLPLNNSLVGGSQPTCNSCLKNTMSVFAAATSDRSSALASQYASAASQVNVNCGPGYVNASLAAAIVSGAPGLSGPSHVGLFTLVLLVASWLL